ncbi:MAG: hypothetical protein HZA46_19030 [Planctomycetales bacterium]|nr:hypothetical protein [Planctomycetales bacterium]
MSRYRDISQLGTGGFGEVWLCRREDDGQMFAKKKLLPSVDEDGTNRFLREVRLLAQLSHPM